MSKAMRHMVLVVGLLVAGKVFAADVYTIDPAHSSIGFSVKHMMVSTVPGTFDDFAGTVAYDAKDAASTKVDVTVQAKSVNTKMDKRDEHLRSPDFFDVAKFPAITFTTKSYDGKVLVGDLTLKGVTKEISVPVVIEGPVKGMMGDEMIGLSGQFTINRQDYGVSWNKTLDAGGIALGNDVIVTVNVEAHKK